MYQIEHEQGSMEHSYQEDVLFRLEIPAGTLTFKEYTKGSNLELRERIRSYKPRAYIKFIILWIVLSIAISTGINQLNFSLGIWSATTGELLATLYDGGILYSILGFYFVGIAIGIAIINRLQRRSGRRIYEKNESCQNGYVLELTDRGMRWTNNIGYGFIVWQKVKAIVPGENVDYLYMNGMYLWIPHNIPEHLRQPAIHFIQKQIAIHHIAQ